MTQILTGAIVDFVAGAATAAGAGVAADVAVGAGASTVVAGTVAALA